MLIIRGEKNAVIPVADLVPEGAEVSALLVDNCIECTLDMSGVRFAAMVSDDPDTQRPMVEVRGESWGCDITHLSHNSRHDVWNQDSWRKARHAVLLRAACNRVTDATLAGVQFGVVLMGPECSLSRAEIQGFSADAVRVLADECSVDTVLCADAMLGDPDEHCDAVQLFTQPGADGLRNIKIRRLVALNDQVNRAGNRWMQGVILTDGVLYDSAFKQLHIETDHQHGLTLAEAHRCRFQDVNIHSPTSSAVQSHICIGTNKKGYNKSSDLMFTDCDADKWWVV